MDRRSLRIPVGVGWSWGLFINLYLVVYFTCRECIPTVAILNHFAHFLTLGASLVFLLAVVSVPIFNLNKWLLLWLLPGAIAFGGWYGQHFIPHSEPNIEGIHLSVSTFNVLGFATDPNQTFAIIEQLDTDLIGIVELRPLLESKLHTKLAEAYPYQVSKVLQGFDGYALLSRYPILEHYIELEVDFDNLDLARLRYLRAVIDIKGQPVVVYVFHPTIPFTNFPFSYDDAALTSQIRKLMQKIETETDPVLLICDCNTTVRSDPYAIIDEQLDEAFGAVGRGFGLTHPSERPVLRIDYIWYSQHFAPITARVIRKSGGSDHLPMQAELVLK